MILLLAASHTSRSASLTLEKKKVFSEGTTPQTPRALRLRSGQAPALRPLHSSSCLHFKQRSGFALKKALGADVGQISYYDHVLRKDEAIIDVAGYIWENPVKEGLVKRRAEYPFSGPREYLDDA